MSSLKLINKELILSALIFITFIVIGMLVDYYLFYDEPLTSETAIDANTLWSTVFMNNLKACLIMILGVFIFGISTTLLLIFNSFLLGTGLVTSFKEGSTASEIILAVLPHGIFEIPALLLAASIGLFGFKFYDQKKYKKVSITLIKLVFIVVILLLIASVIEVNVTIPLK